MISMDMEHSASQYEQQQKFFPWRHIIMAILLVLSLIGLAIVCRGYSPSRFDPINLPKWELATPKQPVLPQTFSHIPYTTTKINFYSTPYINHLSDNNDDWLFAALETHQTSNSGRWAAARPGQWLETAALLASNRNINEKVKRIALRLLNNQRENGYIGADNGYQEYTPGDILSHTANIRGLLSYYAISNSPAAIYSALKGGDFIIDYYHPKAGHEDKIINNSIIYTMVRIYMSTGERQYLEYAKTRMQAPGCDGLNYCALYEATGSEAYRTNAINKWNNKTADPHYTAELFLITGDKKYLSYLKSVTDKSVWPYYVAYTKYNGELSVNLIIPGELLMTHDTNVCVKGSDIEINGKDFSNPSRHILFTEDLSKNNSRYTLKINGCKIL